LDHPVDSIKYIEFCKICHFFNMAICCCGHKSQLNIYLFMLDLFLIQYGSIIQTSQISPGASRDLYYVSNTKCLSAEISRYM
jgi:hypothetical protein